MDSDQLQVEIDEETAAAMRAQIERRLDEEDRRAQIARNQAAIRLIRSWVEEGDEAEQTETLEYLKKALNESRPGQRKHFP